MARNLNNKSDTGSLATNQGTDREVTGEPRGQTGTELAVGIVTDAYNIAIALAMVSAAYWAIFRDLPVGMFGFSLILGTLLAVDILVTVR